MSTTITCECGTIGADPSVVRFAPCHHHYFRGDRQLAGVNRVIKEVWPLKPSWEGVDMAVVENARERGAQVDSLFCSWLAGTLTEIPVGTRDDAVLGFNAVCKWWELEDRGETQTQRVFADDDVVGIPDILTADGVLWDLKCTAKLESTFDLQLGGYIDLARRSRSLGGCGVIHCRFEKGGTVVTVKPVMFDPLKALSEWQALRQFWTMFRRRTA